ncbi:hypothetical protein RJT34_02611 [Clitoria ternatea]|uniref:Uncharacterized protein n=1 Tax=Clitoria ternatea TaxID=43366 RepID=A0AAN9KJA8_CLITE
MCRVPKKTGRGGGCEGYHPPHSHVTTDGSLLGSVLCFVEGCLIVIDSYARYFHILSQRLDPVHLMRQLIEAIDMFLVGSALLVFGMGLYAMFVGSSNETGPRLSGSNLLGLFYMKSMAQAKGKVGHAVMMIVQAGVIEKLKDIPLVTSLDLACFAAAVLTSSALSTSLISLQY